MSSYFARSYEIVADLRKTDITGRDPSKWSLVGWLYGGVYYTSTADFRAAWVKGLSKGARNEEGDWIGSDQTGTAPKLDKKAPPLQVQPDGERFTVDEDNKYVEWSASLRLFGSSSHASF